MNAENTAQRLQEAAAKCLSSLDTWNKDLKNESAREGLLEAVHELRKVTSRLEIDIAMNDRKAMNAKPMPIPEHKSKMEQKKQRPLSEILPVAELREKHEKRKIQIKETDELGEEDTDDVNNNDDTTDIDETNDKKKVRRPRRQKRENDQG